MCNVCERAERSPKNDDSGVHEKFRPEYDRAHDGEHASQYRFHDLARHVLAHSRPDGPADENARDRPRDDVPHRGGRQRVNGRTGDGGDSEDEHAGRDRDPRRKSTSNDQLRGRDLGKSGADESRDEPADGRQADPGRSPAGVVDERLSVPRLHGGLPAAGVLPPEVLAFGFARLAFLGGIVIDKEAPEKEEQSVIRRGR